MYICSEDGQVQALATHHNVDVHICDKPVFYGKNSFFIIIFFPSFVVAHVFSATALRVNDIAQNMHTLNFLFFGISLFFFFCYWNFNSLSSLRRFSGLCVGPCQLCSRDFNFRFCDFLWPVRPSFTCLHVLSDSPSGQSEMSPQVTAQSSGSNR